MKVLLDTHAFLWLIEGDERLSRSARKIFLESDNQLYLSAVSPWEIGIKTSLGKLEMAGGGGWVDTVRTEMRANRIQYLPVELDHCALLQTLPFHHRDPFDRMLIAQAQAESLSVLTRDKNFRRYGIECLW